MSDLDDWIATNQKNIREANEKQQRQEFAKQQEQFSKHIVDLAKCAFPPVRTPTSSFTSPSFDNASRAKTLVSPGPTFGRHYVDPLPPSRGSAQSTSMPLSSSARSSNLAATRQRPSAEQPRTRWGSFFFVVLIIGLALVVFTDTGMRLIRRALAVGTAFSKPAPVSPKALRAVPDHPSEPKRESADVAATPGDSLSPVSPKERIAENDTTPSSDASSASSLVVPYILEPGDTANLSALLSASNAVVRVPNTRHIRHKKSSCDGELIITRSRLEFAGEGDTFSVERDAAQIDNNGVKLLFHEHGEPQKYHFEVAGSKDKAKRLLNDWLSLSATN